MCEECDKWGKVWLYPIVTVIAFFFFGILGAIAALLFYPFIQDIIFWYLVGCSRKGKYLCFGCEEWKKFPVKYKFHTFCDCCSRRCAEEAIFFCYT